MKLQPPPLSKVFAACAASPAKDLEEATRCSLIAFIASWALTLRAAAAAWLGGFGKCESQGDLPQVAGANEAFKQLYKIGVQIGRGSFGKVYACYDVKATTKNQAGSADLCVKIVPSGKSSSSLPRLLDIEHPNLVRLRKIMQAGDTLYVIMDRCCGLDLQDHLAAHGGRLPKDAVRAVAKQAISALAGLHSLSLMHRDVKTENFRFEDVGALNLKLLDYGSVKPCCGTAKQHTITGTLLFAAPEVLDGVYSSKCDLWSLGGMLFFLLSGQMPFETSDLAILRSMHKDPVLNGDNLFRDGWWQEVPTAAKNLASKLLTVDPSARLKASEAEQHSWLLNDQQDDWQDDTEGKGQSDMLGNSKCQDDMILRTFSKKELRRSPRSPDVLGLSLTASDRLTKRASRHKEVGRNG